MSFVSAAIGYQTLIDLSALTEVSSKALHCLEKNEKRGDSFTIG